MRNFTLKGVLSMSVLFVVSALSAQENVILLDVASTGSEGDTKYTDASPLTINESGALSMSGDVAYFDWSVSGTVSYTKAFNSGFSVLIGGMGSTNTTTGSDLGKMLTQAGIDRSGTGEIGIRGGASNGIDTGEGMYFGLDLSDLSSAITMKITGVKVKYLGTGERGTIVNLQNSSKQLTFSISGDGADVELANGSGMVDVSSLEISVSGGDSVMTMLSCYNSAADGNFRIVGLQLTVSEKTSTSNIKDCRTLADNLSLGPNPCKEKLNIRFNSNPAEPVKVRLFNARGETVLPIQVTNNNTTLNTSNLDRGLYFCVISVGQETVTQKIIRE